MIMNKKNKFCTVPQLEKIPHLVHGFGTRDFTEHDILEKPEHRDFILISLKQVHERVMAVNG